jgi:hypothetical protein
MLFPVWKIRCAELDPRISGLELALSLHRYTGKSQNLNLIEFDESDE